jgi:hypothetical protein
MDDVPQIGWSQICHDCCKRLFSTLFAGKRILAFADRRGNNSSGFLLKNVGVTGFEPGFMPPAANRAKTPLSRCDE